MKLQLAFILICMALLPSTGLADRQFAEDRSSFPPEQDFLPFRGADPVWIALGEIYSFQAYSSRIVLGVVLRPDLEMDLGPRDRFFPWSLVQDWIKQDSFLGNASPPLTDALRGLWETPRVFSISIEF